jgi:hypothetical protein
MPLMIKIFRILITFALVSFAWIFFRAQSIYDALYIITHFTNGYSPAELANIMPLKEIMLNVSFIFILMVVDFLREYGNPLKKIMQRNLAIRWAVYYVIIFSIIVFGVYGVEEKSPFIYFQF